MDLRLTIAGPGGAVDVLVSAPVGAMVRDLAARLTSLVGAEADALLSVRGSPGDRAERLDPHGHRLAPDHPLGVAPLLTGCVIDVGRRVPAPPQPGPRQLRVVDGPDSGAVHTLVTGEMRLGRGHGVDIQIADTDLSRLHAVLDVRYDEVLIRDAESTNGTSVEGTDVGPRPVVLRPGAMLRCGGSLLRYTEPTDPPAAVHADGTGGLGLNRPPRLEPHRRATKVVFPSQPADRVSLRFPWMMVVAPLVLGALLWLVTAGDPTFLLVTVLTPVMYAANAIGDRISGGRGRKRELAQYHQAAESVRTELAAAIDREIRQRRDAAPDPAAVLVIAAGPGARLWERRAGDQDTLLLRIGSADLPADLAVTGPDVVERRGGFRRKRRQTATVDAGERHPILPLVPVTVNLRSAAVLGVAGPSSTRVGLARWFAGQLAVLHTPRDLRLVLLTLGGGLEWKWLGWLGHLIPTVDHDAELLVGLDAEQVALRVAELVTVLQARQAGGTGPRYVLVLDGADGLRMMPGVARLLADGPAVGISAICLADESTDLPEECGAIVTVLEGAEARVEVSGEQPIDGVVADLVSKTWAEKLARALAPIRDTTPDGAEGRLPDNARLLDALGAECLDPNAIAAGWQARVRTTTTVLGLGADGTVRIDLARDGPHALVAGTTGAGKSELLQTLVVGLALGNRPDELAFILVDYKGGAAFAQCATLPHTAGLVTDLDERLTARALASLSAELRRREHLLASVGAKDLQTYQSTRDTITATRPARDADEAPPALPRLVIVIDEFASLVAELPDFVTGLVDIARRGRSLGVHLVLATQRPSGAISPEIRANTTLRLCLRVTDATESSDVIDAPDAARISRHTPGRCVARLAAGELTLLQAARVGGRANRESGDAPSIREALWRQAGSPRSGQPGAPHEQAGDTDLAALVSAISTASDIDGVIRPPGPWLPPLPHLITLSDLRTAQWSDLDPGTTSGTANDRVPLGLHDLPAGQRQGVYGFDLAAGGHLMLLGGPRSGRTSAVRTLAGSAAVQFGPDDLHLYALDCAGGGLSCLDSLPHCGTVVQRADPGRGERLIARLLAEIGRRHQLLGRDGYGSVAEHRLAHGEPLPWMVLLIDSYEGFRRTFEDVDHGRPIEDLARLLREGPAAGLQVVVTGDRSLATAQLAALVVNRLVLRMTDADSYVAAGIAPRDMPGQHSAGRALVPDSPVTDVQLALLDPNPAGPAQTAALQRIAADCPHPMRNRPIRLVPVPELVSRTALDGPPLPLWVALGVGGDDAQPLGFDLAADGPGALVAGPPGSGRSTALVTAGSWLAGRGTPVALVSNRRSPLRALAGEPGVVGSFGVDDAADLGSTIDAHRGRPLVVLVDDADQLVESEMDTLLMTMAAQPEDGWGVLASGSTDEFAATYRGLSMTLRRSRCGVLLCPRRPGDGELFGIRVSRGLPSRTGSGLLAIRGEVLPIQIALTAPAAVPA